MFVFAGSAKVQAVAKVNKSVCMKFLLVCLTASGPFIALSVFFVQWTLGCNSLVTIGYFTLPDCQRFASLNSRWSAGSTIQFMAAASIQSWLVLDVVGSSSIVWAFSLVQAYCQWCYLKIVVCLMRDKSRHSMNNLSLIRQLQVA